MLRRNLHADLLKMKGLPVTYAHILIPILTSGIFLSYYSFSGWSENTKIIAFYQAIGAGFPVLIGIFTASMQEQEQNAGACQNLLTLPDKTAAFSSKVVLLLMFSLFSLLLTAGVFWLGCRSILSCRTISIATHLTAALIMWFTGIPIYMWQLLLAFRFGKGVSIGAGIFSGLVSVLLLTDLGMLIWKYIPISWTGRIPYAYLRLALGEADQSGELTTVIPIFCCFAVISIGYFLFRASHWEEIKITD